MKKALGKMKRTISVLLAAAMIITALPQTSALAYASEGQNVLNEGNEAAKIVGEDKENNDTGNSSADADGNTDSGKVETEAPDQTGSEESDAVNQTDVEEKENSDETESGETEVTDQTDPDETDDSEENPDQTVSDETLIGNDTDAEKTEEPKAAEGAGQPKNGNMVSVLGAEDGETGETVLVRLNVPRYENDRYSFLTQVWYAVGENGEFQKTEKQPSRYGVNEIDIPANVGEKLRVKLVLRSRVQIEEVSYSGMEEGAGAITITPEEGEEHIYAIDTIPSGSGAGPVYQINIKADYHYSLHFVDVYASKNPDAENNKSVSFYQHAKDTTADDSAVKTDLIGQTLELSGQEMQEFFSEEKYNYALEVQEGYTFYSIDANTSRMDFRKDKSYYDDGYILSGSYDLGAEDITVFVLAEPTKDNRLTFNIPEELKDKVDITVTYTDPTYGPISGSLEPEDNGIWIKNDRRVWFDVTVKDPDYTVRATCEENGGDAVALPHDSRNEYGSGQGWKSRFYLEDAGVSMKDGDVKINLEQIAIYPVAFQLNPDEIDSIYVYAPMEKSFYYSDYNETGSCAVWTAEGEKLKFRVNPAVDSTLIVSTSEDGSGELHYAYDFDADENVYVLAPTEPMSVYLTMAKGYQYQLDYNVSDFDVKVCDKNGNPIELSADNKFGYTGDTWNSTFRIMVKINSEKWTAASVTYEDELDCRIEAVRRMAYDDEENGYLCYVAEEAGCKSNGANVIAIQGAHTITFAGNKEAELTGLCLRRYERQEWDSWTDWNYLSDIELNRNNKFEVKDGEKVYFALEYFQDMKYSLNLSLSGSGGQLKVYEDEDWDSDNDGTLYYFTAEEDATITAELTERQQHTVTVSSSDSVTDFKVSGSQDRPFGETGNTGKYYVREGNYVIISGITGDESMTGCRGKVVCTTDDKSYEVPMKHGIWIDGEWESGAYFAFEVTADMTVMVDLVQTSQPVITFTGTDKITSAKIWEAGKEPSEENLYNSETGEAVLSDDKEYRLDFQLKDGLAAKSVILKDKLSGEERVLERDEENEYRIYELGVPQGDAEITIETVQGYTVKFDIPAGADITFAEDLTDYQNEITQDSVQVIATESFPFIMTDGEGRYRLSVDSDAFTLGKVLKQPAGSDYDEQYYQYVLKPVVGAQLPAVVKIQAEEYEKHTVTLDYPTEIKTIYLLDDNEDYSPINGKQAEVQGVNTVLGVKAIRGYAAKVSIQGNTTGESRELTPFRLAEDDVSEYYLGELAEDVTITVTAERSTQKLTYYKVGFYSAGNGVKIRDAGTKTLYSANWYYDGEFEYPYSILKGSSISFTVEPREGYEVDGVYANGEAVKPVQGISSQEDVYTVVPMADTLITVKISQIAEKYPLTFTCPAAVQSVTVKGYELTDKKLEVKAGAKLEFTVELADTKHRITSVTMNGKDAVYNKDSGCYSITTVAAPMEVVITTAENIDKEVTFKNTVTHMLYSVATNAQVTESGTDTYTVAALASVLRFTVTSAKKESVPVVSYTDAAGGKIVLQAKTTQENETTTAYTYEILVSQLAVESEIVIGETTVASADDKAKLDECIKKYKDKYNQEEYTPESWAAYTKALKAAEDCMEKENATKAEVEAAIADLEKAVKGLTKIGEEPTPGAKEGLWFEILENEETADGSYIYTGAAIKPDIKVYNGDMLLEVKKDYTVAYKNNTNAGTATITVTGKANFNGKATADFTINQKDIRDEDISVTDVYAIMKANGTVANPKVTVKFGKKTLKANNDYKVIYPELEKDEDGKIVAKDYEITISTTAVKKVNGTDVDSTNYTGSRTITYTVLANDAKLMSKATITLTAKNVDYADRNDPAKRPQVKTVKISGKEVPLEEFIITDTGYEQAGKATITVTGKDQAKYYGRKSVSYDVKGTKLSASGFAIGKIDSQDYTGAPIYINQEAADASMRKLEVKPKSGGTALTEGTDYTVSYATGKKVGEHTNAGTVTVTITGIGEYTGSMKTTFKITPVDLSTIGSNNAFVFAAPEAAKYTKTGAKPEITTLTFNGAELVEKKDYTITYQKNAQVKSGEKSATMTIKGKGNFKGTYKHEYEVTTASKDDVYVTATDIVKPAKFSQVKSTIKVFETETGKALKAGTDYEKTITYYSDEACEKQITADNFDKPIAENSKETPTDVDAVIYAKIDMKGSYAGTAGASGSVTTKFRVYNKDLKMTSKQLDVTINTAKGRDGKDIICDATNKHNPYYTGAAIEPEVTVTVKGSNPAETLTEGVDYKVEYTNNVNKGKATVTVTGIGNGYGGAKSVKFTIVAKDMKWAEQTVKKAAEALSGFIPVTE